MNKVPDFSKWHGVDRNQIQWNPVIDEAKCVGCGMCVTSCGREVFKFDYQRKKAMVVNPNHCMVACQTCANLCPVGAISFTKKGGSTREKAQEIVRKFGVSEKIRKELEEKKDSLKIKGGDTK